MSSGSNDRVHSALVALSFLTLNEPSACQRLASRVDTVVPLVSDSVIGARLAALSLMRNVFVVVESSKSSIVELGCLKACADLLLALLGDSSDVAKVSVRKDEIYEVVMDVKDLMDAPQLSVGINVSFARRADRDGLVDALKKTADSCKRFDTECAQEAGNLVKKIQLCLSS